MSTGPFDLAKTPIHLATGADAGASPIEGFSFDGPAFVAYAEQHTSDDAPGRLVMIETTASDWPAWECHPMGDELVIVLEGRGTLRQEIDGEERCTPFAPGDTFVNPAGVWHTADVTEPMKAIYITPGRGTEHRAR